MKQLYLSLLICLLSVSLSAQEFVKVGTIDRSYSSNRIGIWENKFIYHYFDSFKGGIVSIDPFSGDTIPIIVMDSIPHSSSIGLAFKNNFYFVYGRSLWKTAGSKETTELVSTIGFITSAIVYHDFIYLRTLDGLWRSDGTAAGTTLLKSSIFENMTYPLGIFQDKLLYFQSENDSLSLYSFNHVDSSDYLIINIRKPVSSINFRNLDSNEFIIGVQYYPLEYSFQELKSDGTNKGTTTIPHSTWLTGIAVLKGKEIRAEFYNIRPSRYSILWSYDPVTKDSTTLVKLQDKYEFTALTVYNNQVYCINSRYAIKPYTLWVTDGTAAGTHLIPLEGSAINIKVFKDYLFIISLEGKILLADKEDHLVSIPIPAGVYAGEDYRSFFVYQDIIYLETFNQENSESQLWRFSETITDIEVPVSTSAPIVYPSPFQESFTIPGSIHKLTLLNVMGEVMLQLEGDQLKKAINTANFPSGLYTFIFLDKEGNTTLQKVIKN